MAFESGLLFNYFVLVLVLFLTFLAERASRPPPFPSHPKAASLGGGGGLEGAKMALGLACGQGWWRSCSVAAIFPRGGRRPVWRRQAGPGAAEPEPRCHARAAGSCGWSPRGHRDPRPKGWLAGLGAKGRRRLAFVSGRK